jgi:beta-glucanase (GH16 family)
MRLRAAVFAALLAGGLVGGLAGGFAPAAHAADPPGWRPLWSSDFTGAALPSQCWQYDGPHSSRPTTSYYRPDEVNVGGGMLRVSMHKRSYGGRQYTTGGMGCFKVVQLYGRYEFRAKVPLGVGIDSYVTLFPDEDGVTQQASFIEILGRPGNETMELTNEYGSGTSGTSVPGTYSDDFHTYTIEWSPAAYRVLVDGQQKFVDTKHISAVRKWIGFATSSGDGLTGLPDAQTQLPAEFLVDWVHVSSYAPGAVPRATSSAGPSRSAAPSASPSAAPAGADAPSARAGLSGLAIARRSYSGPSPVWYAVAVVAALAVAVLGYGWRRRRVRPRRHADRG